MKKYDTSYFHSTVFGKEPRIPLVRAAHIVKPGKALDLGSGDGNEALYLASQGFQVTAVDFSKVAIQKLQQNARKKALSLQTIIQKISPARSVATNY